MPSGFVFARVTLDQRRGTSLFGGFGTSNRYPTSVERYLQSPSPLFHGNPDLEPTRNKEFDLGIETDWQRLSLRVKGFYSDLPQFIYQAGKQTPDSHKTWTNIDAHLYGLDLKANLPLHWGFSLDGGFAYQRGRKDTFPDAFNRNENLAGVPPFRARGRLMYSTQTGETSSLLAFFEWNQSSASRQVDVDAGEQPLSGWNAFNLRAGYTFNRHWRLRGGIENIFNRHYAMHNSYEFDVVAGTGAHPPIMFEPGRTVFGSISLVW
jgi:iron complex outermembrane receptor protein